MKKIRNRWPFGSGSMTLVSREKAMGKNIFSLLFPYTGKGNMSAEADGCPACGWKMNLPCPDCARVRNAAPFSGCPVR